MLKEIIRKEILENIKGPKIVFTFLLCTILILLSLYTGINKYRADLREYNAGVSLNKKLLESRPDYGEINRFGIKINKPPQVLSTIVIGIEDAVGRQATVNTSADPNLVDSKHESNPVFAIFNKLDLILIVKIILSLFAILFSYNTIVGEKERNTLKLVLSNNVPRDLLIFGKACGNFISMLFTMVTPLFIGILIFTIFPDVSLSLEDWIRIGLIFVIFFLYILVFFAIGLFVSSMTHHSSNSLLISLFIWVMFISIIPETAVMTAGYIDPIPSVYEITAQKDAFIQEMDLSLRNRYQKWRKENDGQYKDFKTYRENFSNFMKELQEENIRKKETKCIELDKEYQAKRRRQEMLAVNLSRISPASALTFGSMSLGKTGIHEHEHFLNSIKTYKTVFSKWAMYISVKNSKTESSNSNKEKPDISELPQFEFKPESLRASFTRAIPDFLILILMSIVFFTGAFVSFLRYDVR